MIGIGVCFILEEGDTCVDVLGFEDRRNDLVVDWFRKVCYWDGYFDVMGKRTEKRTTSIVEYIA